MEPAFSIITINYNNAAGLKESIESVRGQTYKGFEYLIIDGGSADGSKQIIEGNLDLLSYWCSEKDKGVYDAQNKGILKTKGKYLIFLNSGDVFASRDFLEKTERFIKQNSGKSFIYANTILKNTDGSLYNIIQPPKLDLFFFYQKTLNHQSCIIQKQLFDTYGLHDISYKICADFDFILKVFLKEPNQFIHFNEFAVLYENSGMSANPANYEMVVKEREQILKKYLTQEQLSDCVRQERKMQSWQTNLKRQLYANKITYAIIKFYVKIKEAIWKK